MSKRVIKNMKRKRNYNKTVSLIIEAENRSGIKKNRFSNLASLNNKNPIHRNDLKHQRKHSEAKKICSKDPNSTP